MVALAVNGCLSPSDSVLAQVHELPVIRQGRFIKILIVIVINKLCRLSISLIKIKEYVLCYWIKKIIPIYALSARKYLIDR